MKKKITMLFLLICLLSGCGEKKTTNGPVDCVPTEDCFLCGREAYFWGQNNIGLISLNTFELMPIGINQYDDRGELIEEITGTFRLRDHQCEEDGFYASVVEESDHGYAMVSVTFKEDRRADREKAGDFLCADCLEQILPEGEELPSGLGVVNLLSGKIRVFDEHTRGFSLGDFYIHCDWKKDEKAAELFLFYSPLRYGEEE